MTETVDKLRNISIVAHGGAGKTSLAEALLFNAGVTNRLGRVEDGNTVMDFEPEELKRQSSVSSAFHRYDWKKHTISLIDTPGDQNFFTDTRLCIQASDSVVVVVDAVDGVKVQTEQAWDFAAEFNQPCLIVINKLDRERADFNRTFQDCLETLGKPKPIILQLPIGAEADFKGVVDLVTMKAYTYDESGQVSAVDIPADMQDTAAAEREALIENIAEADDELVEKYLEGEDLTDEEIHAALRKGTVGRVFVPVVCGAATQNIGMDLVADYIVACMPSPTDKGARSGVNPANGDTIERLPDPEAPFSALVFKTIADPYAGRLSIFRVVSGTLGSDGGLYNVKSQNKERFNQLLTIAGKEQKPAAGAGPGILYRSPNSRKPPLGIPCARKRTQLNFPAPTRFRH